MSKVNYEIAVNSVNSWLDHKRIPSNKRESLQGMIDNIVSAVADGDLVLDDQTMIWKHILVFPLTDGEGNATVKEITYKVRLSDRDIKPYKKAVKGNDFDATLKRTILALTNQAVGIIEALDSSTDRSIAESIAVFFV